MWRNSCDGAIDVFCVQATGENKEASEWQRRSRGRPIAGQSRPAAQIRMRRVKKQVTIGKCADIFGMKFGVSAESANDAKFTRQAATYFRRQISVQLDAFDPGCLCYGTNFVSGWIDKHADHAHAPRKRLDNLYIEPDRAGEIVEALPRSVRVVGVFVD